MRAARARLSLRRRVAFALVAIVALFVSVQGVLAYLSLEEQEDEVVDELVLAEARRLATRAAPELRALGPNFSAWLVAPGGHADPAPPPAHLAALADGQHRVRLREAELHVVVLPAAGGRLFVQYDASANESKVREFGLYLLGLVAVCILSGILVSLRVAAVVVAPIERLAGLLRNWAPGASGRGTAASDEESSLLEAFDRVQARLEQAIAREREFTANLQHEIRTPLAAARTDVEMLGLDHGPGSAAHLRIQRALAALDALAGQVESARALAASRRPEARAVDLAQCVADAWASLGGLPEARGLDFANEIPAGTVVQADPHGLLTILRNLIRNAAEHAAPARCVARATAAGVEVVDDGPGIAPADLPHVFERYYRARRADAPGQGLADERGLGLAIARQLADLNGWRLEAAPGDGPPGRPGARFVLTFGGI